MAERVYCNKAFYSLLQRACRIPYCNSMYTTHTIAKRHFNVGIICKAKKISAVSSTVRTGIEVEKDAAILTKYCCGANVLKEGSDPELKPDSEYPNWLWELDLQPNNKTVEEINQNSFKYWRRLRKEHIKRKNIQLKLQFK